MSLLAPLFLLGTTAIALPILFHLIRRTSREKVPFSSLMFLNPTPPRVTRKSRLENILLLILRCTIIALLALAFARPYLRRPAGPQIVTNKRMVLLLDTSASMKREGLWPEARSKAVEVAKKAAAGDELAIMLFDRTTRSSLTFEDWKAAAPGDRAALVTQRLQAVEPGWAATQLGHALVTATELLEHDAGAGSKREIVVISDFQDGARVDALQGFEWPKQTTVTPIAIKAKRPTNGGVQILPEPAVAIETVKARVSNSSQSTREQFDVRWSGSATSTLHLYIAPGQSRVVDLPKPAGADRAMLSGDDEDFDNSAWFVPPAQQQVSVAFLGSDAEGDPQRPLFYLQRAFSETTHDSVHVLQIKPGTSMESVSNAALIVVSEALSPAQTQVLSNQLRGGSMILWVVRSASDATSLAALCGQPISTAESSVSKYAMLGEIDFAHPLFAPFADTRFSDFTKIHFWKYRRLTFDPSPNARAIAKFDSGDLALAQFSIGKGILFVLASGWQPAESQLALSSKFVPLLYSMLELSGAIKTRPSSLQIGDAVDLTGIALGKSLTIRKPGGKTVEIEAGQNSFTDTDEPGIYSVTTVQPPVAFAINLAAEESKTAPLAMEELSKLGVPINLSLAETTASAARKAAQLKSAELESRQRLWRWLIAATVMVLMVETWIAARLSWRAATVVGT